MNKIFTALSAFATVVFCSSMAMADGHIQDHGDAVDGIQDFSFYAEMSASAFGDTVALSEPLVGDYSYNVIEATRLNETDVIMAFEYLDTNCTESCGDTVFQGLGFARDASTTSLYSITEGAHGAGTANVVDSFSKGSLSLYVGM